MKYIKKKLDSDIYAVLDTDIDEIKNYSYSELKYMYDNGTYIRGVAYIEGDFIVTPVVPLYSVTNEYLMVKNKLLLGVATGVKGFDLKVEGNDVFALPLSSDFYDYVNRNKTGDKFVFVIPDGVTELNEEFLVNGFFSLKDIKIFVDLPESLRVINTSSLISNKSYISNIRFNSVVDIRNSIEEPIRYDYGYGFSCSISDTNCGYMYEFRSKVLNVNSICFSSRLYTEDEFINLRLPDTECINESSIFTDIARLNIFLGDSIREIHPFSASPFYDKNVEASEIMGYASTVYIPDNCILDKVGLCSNFYEDDMYSSYIAVLSDSMYSSLKIRYSQGELIIEKDPNKCCCWVGVLTYSTDEELDTIKDNIELYLSDPEKYFSRYLTSDDFGKIIKLELKAGI